MISNILLLSQLWCQHIFLWGSTRVWNCPLDTKKVNWLWSIYNDRTVYRRLIRLFYRNPILGALLFNLFYCIGEVIRVLILFWKNKDSLTSTALIFIETEIAFTTFCIFCIHGVRNLSEEQVSHSEWFILHLSFSQTSSTDEIF